MGGAKLKYSSKGNPIPQNVIDAMTLAAKAGFITRTIWNEFYGVGNPRWKRRQFLKMQEENLIEPFSNSKISDAFILSRKGKSLLLGLNMGCSTPPYSSTIDHDEFVTRSLLKLKRCKILSDWSPECELKRTNALQFDIGVSAKEQKYPDAIFEMSLSGKRGTFAIEYERSLKSASRYKDILWLYSKANNIDVVVYICKDKLIENTIRGRLTFLRNLTLFKKIGFVDALDWSRNPEDAVINFHNTSLTLKNLNQRKIKNDDIAIAPSMAR